MWYVDNLNLAVLWSQYVREFVLLLMFFKVIFVINKYIFDLDILLGTSFTCHSSLSEGHRSVTRTNVSKSLTFSFIATFLR